jgi:hypothetical protein
MRITPLKRVFQYEMSGQRNCGKIEFQGLVTKTLNCKPETKNGFLPSPRNIKTKIFLQL